MHIQGLQNALARIEAIKNRFEGPPKVSGKPVNNQPAGFAGALNEAASKNDGVQPLKGNVSIERLINTQASRHEVDPALIRAMVHAESAFNPRAVSSAGAQGLMQLMPGTASDLGVADSFNPAQNLDGGIRYIKGLMGRYDGSLPKALAAYNAGPGNVDRYGGVPPFAETTGYVDKVINLYKQYAGGDS